MGDEATGSNESERQSLLGWRKSSHSMSNGQCLEAASLPGGKIAVRDSTAPEGPMLRFEKAAWVAHLLKVQA